MPKLRPRLKFFYNKFGIWIEEFGKYGYYRNLRKPLKFDKRGSVLALNMQTCRLVITKKNQNPNRLGQLTLKSMTPPNIF